MQKKTKVLLAAGAMAIAGAVGVSTLASAEYRGSHGGKHGGWKGHHGHHGHHGGWRKGRKFSRLMERFDLDEDGKLTQDELNKARTQLLEKHDGDKDGELSLAEFEKLWLEVMHRRMVRGFQRLDEDGSANITLDEFLKPFSSVVERFDRNGDGALDKEDRRHRHHKRHKMDGEKKEMKSPKREG